MTAFAPPRRTTSTPTTLDVVSLEQHPAWVPPAGAYQNVTRADNGQIHLAQSINPDVYDLSGNPTPYPTIFSETYPAFIDQWRQQTGTVYNAELGPLGSLIFYGGGHATWGGTDIIRFDIATGKWSIIWQNGVANYANTDKSVENGTVATLTGTVSTRHSLDISTPDRVSLAGNYIKTSDDVPIVGAGDTLGQWGVGTGDGATGMVFNPYPIHTNRGICILPSEAGGGPLGSLLIHGHNQTGIRDDTTKWTVYKFNFATQIWDHAWRVGDLMTNSRPEPTLFYDSSRKLIWEHGGNGRPIVLNYLTMTRHYPSLNGTGINLTGGYLPGYCYVPGHDIAVYMRSINTGSEAWAQRDGAPAGQGGGCYFYPTVGAYSHDGYVFGAASSAWSQSPFTVNCNPSNFQYRDRIDTGADTGWPGFRTATNGYNGTSLLYPGESGWHGATDSGGVMQSGRWGWLNSGDNGRLRGINDGLDYCSYPGDECLFFVDRRPGPAEGVARDPNAPITLWRLTPPAIGRASIDPWPWTREEIQPMNVGVGGPAIDKVNRMPSWGGKCQYIPALKCILMSDGPHLPVQAIRSSSWT